MRVLLHSCKTGTSGYPHKYPQYLGSGANLLYCMNINAKLEFIDQ